MCSAYHTLVIRFTGPRVLILIHILLGAIPSISTATTLLAVACLSSAIAPYVRNILERCWLLSSFVAPVYLSRDAPYYELCLPPSLIVCLPSNPRTASQAVCPSIPKGFSSLKTKRPPSETLAEYPIRPLATCGEIVLLPVAVGSVARLSPVGR